MRESVFTPGRTADTLAETLDALEASAAILDAHAGANPAIARVAQALAAMAATAGGEDFARLVGLHGHGGLPAYRARVLRLRNEALRRIWGEHYQDRSVSRAADVIAQEWRRFLATYDPKAQPPAPGTEDELYHRLARLNLEPLARRSIIQALGGEEPAVQPEPF